MPKQHLERFINAYCNWPSGRHLLRYAAFSRVFHADVRDAIRYIADVGSSGREDLTAEVRSIIYRLRDQWAWNVDVPDFSVVVPWRAGNDVFKSPWSTLGALLGEIQRLLPLRVDAPERELYALLLSQLLPIYFVKAANISPMVEAMEALLPNFVLLASGAPSDGRPSRNAPFRWDYRYDACRGFQPCFVDRSHCLALVYNPEAELVPPIELERQERTLRDYTVSRLPRTRPTVNFIWYGTGDPTAANTGFADAIARQLPHVIVRYWCLNEKLAAFERALPRSTRLRSIEHLLDEAEACWGAELGLKIRGILGFYATTRVFAPAKDLVSFVMLALHGGYFFDANCTIRDWGTFEGALMTPRPLPALLTMKEELSYSAIDPETYVFDEFPALTAPMVLFNTRDDPQIREFPQTDMWAMYASVGGSPAFEVTVQQYVKRAVRAGLLKVGSERTGGQSDFCASLAGLRGDDARARDLNKRGTAGALAIQSLYGGIHSLGDTYAPRTSGFPCVNTGSDSYSVECLGLLKTHGGTW